MSRETVAQCEKQNVYVFRINLSHTPIEAVGPTIDKIKGWTGVPICLDSEGAQLRNHKMAGDGVKFFKGDEVKIHFKPVIGDRHNISFTPINIAPQLVVGDSITVDFNHACLKVVEKHSTFVTSIVESGGIVGSNKASDVNRELDFLTVSPKDEEAIKISLDKGIKHFALSFANRRSDVELMRELCGPDSIIISKIESPSGVLNLEDILEVTDEILIDRGDLSRKIPLKKIPFLQRKIISIARAREIPVYVATNLLESMVTQLSPTRAELNDVVSTLLMGASGLVLAAETAIGDHPVGAVEMIRRLIQESETWTTETALSEMIRE